MEEFGRERMGERAAAKCFENLVVWQKAHQFVLLVYRLTKMFPREEIYGLTVQFRRAAVSVAAKFAEGFRKRGHADKLRFLHISQGSAEECRYDLTLAKDLGYRTDPMAMALFDEVGRLLVAYAKGIARSMA